MKTATPTPSKKTTPTAPLGRPPAERPSQLINVRVAAEDFDMLAVCAGSEKLSPALWMRDIAVAEAKRRRASARPVRRYRSPKATALEIVAFNPTVTSAALATALAGYGFALSDVIKPSVLLDILHADGLIVPMGTAKNQRYSVSLKGEAFLLDAELLT